MIHQEVAPTPRGEAAARSISLVRSSVHTQSLRVISDEYDIALHILKKFLAS
jgi:hypothetical protein